MKKSELKSLVKEVINEVRNTPQAQFALGYRAGQNNYYDNNLIKDFTGYSEDFQKGYKEGIKDARWGKVNDKIRNFLTSFGNVLGHGRYRP